MRPYQAILALESLRNSFSAPLHRKGVTLTASDRLTVLEVYQQWLLLSLDLGFLQPDEFTRTSRRLWSDMTKVDVFELVDSLTECLYRVREQNLKGFKALCSRVSTHLYPLVKEDLQRCARGDVFAARRLIQLFSYMGRLTLNDIDLTQSQLDDYLRVESEIAPISTDLPVAALNKIIKRWFGFFPPTLSTPSHGRGGVAGHGRCSLAVKYKDLTSDALLEYAFGQPEWTISPLPSTLDRVSQTIFVPKSYKSFRTISMEPTTLQYFQQAVWRTIDESVSSSSYLRNRIGFHDQTRNQRLARLGSLSRDYATLDLSCASDSVSYDLVKRLFSGTWLLRFIVATRSRKTLLPDGSIIDLRKFAPMGSALCFPIETIIFASICELVTRRHHVNGDYSVFGDDIIIPTSCVTEVISMLEIAGFHVNHTKSYYSSQCWFRESCGGEYCDGVDVTPLRVSRSYASTELDVRLTQFIDLSNSAKQKQFWNLRSFFIKKLLSQGFKVRFADSSLHSDSCTNYQLKKRWNRGLQRFEVKHDALATKFVRCPNESEEIRLLHWFHLAELRYSTQFALVSQIGRPMVKLKTVWSDANESFDQGPIV